MSEHGPTVAERLAAMRRSYERAGLDEADLAPTWLEQLQRWLADAERDGISEPNAMVLATSTPDGVPGARIVLLKGLDERGLVFHTNRDSRKGRELGSNPRAAIVFPWHALQRQVIVEGPVAPIAEAESDAYWAGRPRGSQIGSAASPQSRVVAGRAVVEQAFETLAAAHPEPGPIPRPERWGGLRLAPERAEFWQGRVNRVHDRLCFRRTADGWIVERLAP